MTTQIFQSSNHFAKSVFEMHGMTPVNIDHAQRKPSKGIRIGTRLHDGLRQSSEDIVKPERREIRFDRAEEDSYSREVFSLRHQVFAERLKWQVVSLSGLEVDRYDLMNPWYVTIENDDQKVVGTWRALPTTGSYMLRDIFPELARGEEIPNDPSIWEISRFSVDELAKEDGGLSEAKCVADLTLRLLNTFRDFGEANDVEAFVAVTSVAAERIMKKLGFKVRRMGDRKPMMIGKVLSTAIWIDCKDLRRTAAYRSPTQES